MKDLLKCFSLFLFLLFWQGGQSQNGLADFDKAHQLFDHEKMDSASFIFENAIHSKNATERLRALSGLLKIAIFNLEEEKADSLIQIAERISKGDISEYAYLEFEMLKGEYFRQNSDFKRALAIHRNVMNKSSGVKSLELLHSYALMYTSATYERLNIYDSAVYYVDRAHQMFLKQLDTNHVKFASVYNHLGVSYYRDNRIPEAKKYYLKAARIAEEKIGPVSRHLAVTLANLSSICRSEDDFLKAIEYAEKALKIVRFHKDEDGMARNYYHLGVYYYYLGDYGRTKDYMEATIRIRERLYHKNHYLLAGPYDVMGIALEEAGDYKRSLLYHKKAIENKIANFGPSNMLEGYSYENIALCYQVMGQLDSALHYIQLANNILPAKLDKNDYSLATHYFSYANLSYLTGNLADAERYITESNRIYEVLTMQNSTEYAQNIALQGLIAVKQDEWEFAGDFFAEALEKVRVQDEEKNSFQLTPNSLWILDNYMEYLFKRYRATADERALNEFNKFSAIYLEHSDKLRKQFSDPYTKSILIKNNAVAYKRNTGIYFNLYKSENNKKYLESAFNYSEYGRTALLRDMIDDRIISFAGIPDSTLKKEKELRKKLSELNQQLIDEPGSIALKKEIFETKEQFNKHIEESLKTNPKYYDLKFNTRIISLEEVVSKLDSEENLIEFMQDDSAYYALIINKDHVDLIYLASEDRVNNSIKKWQESLIERKVDLYKSGSRDLYQLLWEPLAGNLKGERVTIVPCGPLFYVNFETLVPDGKSPYLIYDYNISYALSLNVLFSDDPVPNSNNKGLTVAIAPGFEDDIKQNYKSRLAGTDEPDEEFLHLVRQPGSLSLANILESRFNSIVYTGEAANEKNVKSVMQQGNILHFATHAVANSSDPMRSKLILAKDIGPQKEDGYLHAYELYGLSLDAELAVLSTCESGIGYLQDGEGMISLAYSMNYAGCPSTVMSLWKVDEKSNTEIISRFYDYLADGDEKSDALRKAKLEYLNSAQGELAHPYYWAGMVLMGQDGLVHFEENNWHLLIWIAAGLLILLVMFLIFRRRKKRSAELNS